jgi:hypothetical protein
MIFNLGLHSFLNRFCSFVWLSLKLKQCKFFSTVGRKKIFCHRVRWISWHGHNHQQAGFALDRRPLFPAGLKTFLFSTVSPHKWTTLSLILNRRKVFVEQWKPFSNVYSLKIDSSLILKSVYSSLRRNKLKTISPFVYWFQIFIPLLYSGQLKSINAYY